MRKFKEKGEKNKNWKKTKRIKKHGNKEERKIITNGEKRVNKRKKNGGGGGQRRGCGSDNKLTSTSLIGHHKSVYGLQGQKPQPSQYLQ